MRGMRKDVGGGSPGVGRVIVTADMNNRTRNSCGI